MSVEKAVDIVVNLGSMSQEQLDVVFSNLGALKSQYPDKFSELLKRENAAGLIKKFSNGNITKFMASKKDIFEFIMSVEEAVDIVVNLGRMSPEQLEVMFSKGSYDSLRAILDKGPQFVIKFTNWFVDYSKDFLEIVLGEKGRGLFCFLLRCKFFKYAGDVPAKQDNYVTLVNYNLMNILNLLDSDELKLKFFGELLGCETEKLEMFFLDNENDGTPLGRIIVNFGVKDSLAVVEKLHKNTDSGSLKIFLSSEDYLKKIQVNKLNVINALLKFEPNVFQKFLDNNEGLFNRVLDIPNALKILEKLKEFGEDTILMLINKGLFNKGDPLKILRFLEFFKKKDWTNIINNRFDDLCSLDLKKFGENSFSGKGNKRLVRFLDDNSIPVKNLLILSTEMITFLFGNKFLYDESGSIIEGRKEILCKILGNEELTKAFSDVKEIILNDGLLRYFPELFAEIIDDEKALDIIRALSYPEINNPVFWTSVYVIYSHVEKENKGGIFVTFLKALLFGKYDGPPLKINTELVSYNEKGEEKVRKLVFYDKEGKKIKKDEVEFRFGENPVENIKEIYKETGGEFGTDDFMNRLEALFMAYCNQGNNDINNDIINTNLVNNHLQT